ncbi:hypothetical protein PsorP6_004470 [Peronosclerospora sorghi]|uniref:Uncharacterized protein n=1 Tax=Peronosclerospora sorghi TaxID=230839 RepID=A0ACC0VJA6_9STRA|nr:hypothetical protein PsorP6_004470 [Peronosclerospora sorghi]
MAGDGYDEHEDSKRRTDGFTNLLSVNFSERVIDGMKVKHPKLQWKVMDMANMKTLKDESFDLVMDKDARQRWLTHEVEATQWFAMTQAALRQLKVGRHEIIELIAYDKKDTASSDEK